MANPIRRAIEQKRGRDWVASQDGHVHLSVSRGYNDFTEQWTDSDSLLAPQWLVDAIGIDVFDTVETVVLDNMEVKDLSPITDLRNLETLEIVIEIDDQLDFSPLTDLPTLRHLHLDYTNISAERLAKFQELLGPSGFIVGFAAVSQVCGIFKACRWRPKSLSG